MSKPMVRYSFSEIEAQNDFKAVIEQAIQEPVVITRGNRPLVYMLSPQTLEDWVDGFLAKEAEKEGLLSLEETEQVLNAFRSTTMKDNHLSNPDELPPCK